MCLSAAASRTWPLMERIVSSAANSRTSAAASSLTSPNRRATTNAQ
jgi:hypothetical protein